MKVKEAMAALEKLHPERDVVIETEDGFYSLTSIYATTINKKLVISLSYESEDGENEIF